MESNIIEQWSWMNENVTLDIVTLHYILIDLKWLLYQIKSYHHIISHTSSTAQGGSGSFKHGTPIGEVGCVNDGWQSEPTDEPTSGWRQRSVVVVVVAVGVVVAVVAVAVVVVVVDVVVDVGVDVFVVVVVVVVVVEVVVVVVVVDVVFVV